MFRGALTIAILLSAMVFAATSPEPVTSEDALERPPLRTVRHATVDRAEALPALPLTPGGAFVGGGEPLLLRTEHHAASVTCCLPGDGFVLFDNGDYAEWRGPQGMLEACTVPEHVAASVAAVAPNVRCVVGHGHVDARVANAIAALVASPPEAIGPGCVDCSFVTLTSFVGEGWSVQESEMWADFYWWSHGDADPFPCRLASDEPSKLAIPPPGPDQALCQAIVATRPLHP